MIHRNLPTTSDASAMAAFGVARNRERDALIECVTLRPGMTVLDVQAAGGYLSDAVYRRLDGRVHCICVEPNAALRTRLHSAYRGIDNPVERFPDVADASVDVVLGLAALHHSESHLDTLRECFRTLRHGGELAICDVPAGSALARWFDEYVDRHNPDGHRGNFPAPGAMSALLESCGFVEIDERLRDVAWTFRCRADIAAFFKGLFGLVPAAAEIDRALDRYFELRDLDDRVEVRWELLYARARKP